MSKPIRVLGMIVLCLPGLLPGLPGSPAPAFAATYCVDGDHLYADDANPGTLELPWRTIGHAAGLLFAGDSVLIRDAIYQESVVTGHGGNAGAAIVFAAFPGEHPVLDGTGLESGTGFRMEDSHVELQGLEIRHFAQTGIWMTGVHDVVLRDCEVHHVIFGIGACCGTHDFLLERVEIHHFTLYGFDASPSGGADCYNGTFNDCVAHTCNDPEQNVDGFALGHGGQHDFVFNRCEAYDLYDGFDISARNTTLNRCAAHDCVYRGIAGWQDGLRAVNCLFYRNQVCHACLVRGGQLPHTYVFQNCTFMDADVYTIYVDSTGAGIQLDLRNCILAGGDNVGLWIEQLEGFTYEGDYNVFHNDNAPRAIWGGGQREFSLEEIDAGEWSDFCGCDESSLVAYEDTDLFVSPSGFDLRLFENSLAVDQGSGTGAPSEDFAGCLRPAGQGVDIGAYEYLPYGDAGDGRSAAAIPRLSICPDPVAGSATIRYCLEGPSHVTLAVFDVTGRRAVELLSTWQPAGAQACGWRSAGLPAGIFFVRLSRDGRVLAQERVVIVR
ncbi:MAG: right-handed parallel beta-helix repeat-containing protein [Candidatus Eisenbacteria bacterium]